MEGDKEENFFVGELILVTLLDEDEKDDFEDDLFDIELDEIDEKCEDINNKIDRIEDELDNMERVAKQGIFITLCEMFKKSKKK